MRLRSALAIVGLGLNLAAGATLAMAAQDPPRAVIVLDSSGTMLNPLETFKKYYLVRKTLQSQLATPPQAMATGVLAYGHRRRADCDDVELLRPIEPFDSGRVLNAAFSVRPRGQSPVSEALKAAAEALGSGGGKVLLIAGSGDSCQQDPCATAKDLAAAEPGLAIDVLSMGASETDVAQFQCIADAARGRVFAATTMADTPVAFADAFAALSAPPAVVPPPAPAAPTASAGLVLSAVLAPGGPVYGQPLAWIVRSIEGGKPGAVVFRAASPTAVAPLPPGSYDVEALGGPIDVHQPAVVQNGQPTNLAVPLNAASLRIKATGGKPDQPPSGVYYTIYQTASSPEDDMADATVAMLHEPLLAPLLLPPGSYRIAASRGEMRLERTLDLAAGQDQVAEFALSSGVLQIEAADSGGDPKAAAPIYFVSEDDPDQPLGRRDVAQSAMPNPSFELPPGIYHVSTRQDASKVRLDAVVKAGEVTHISVPPSTGRLRLETEGLPGGPGLPEDLISYTVERLDESGQPGSIAARRSSGQATIELEAGMYRVTGRVGLVNIAATADVTVKPGAETRTVLQQRVGLLDLGYGDEPGSAVDVLWEIRDADGKVVWSTMVPAPLVPLAPGAYTVHVSRLGKDQSATVSLAPGERKTVAIKPE